MLGKSAVSKSRVDDLCGTGNYRKVPVGANSATSSLACRTRKIVAGFLAIASIFVLVAPAMAKVLQGGVQEEDEITRLARPQNLTGSVDQPSRLQRPLPAPDFHGRPVTGMIDTHAFHPLAGNATNDDAKLGLLKPNDFASIPASKFDLGADRGSKELTLAWETWHHQLSHAIYLRWGQVASVPGKATLKITVTKDRHIMPMLVSSSGNPVFDDGLMQSVRSLDGNPGLTFPSMSQRSVVSMEADYVAATDIQPGFSWVKNDYEHINSNY
jgi:hypothetical protein